MTALAKELNFNIPELLTKRLAIKKLSNGKRKIVVSTNWLPLVGFEINTPNTEKSLGRNKGIVIERVKDKGEAQGKVKKVYSRVYRTRRNNPIEAMLDIGGQKLLDESFPTECSHVHIVFTQDRIEITPLTSHQERALNNAKKCEDPLSVFAACTSGVDLHAMVENDFTVNHCIEYRPFEKRDKRDLTETGALNVLANIKGIKSLYNEDITTIDTKRLAADAAKSPCTTFVISPVCDDFSNVKANSLKEKSLDDLSSGIDMGYDLLRIVEALAPPTILIENVSGWVKSDMYKIISLRLRRWGYKEHCLVADARDYGGLTSRKRAYSFFSVLPSSFDWEKPVERRTAPIWDIIKRYLPDCRDVTHSKSLNDGKETGRLRVITPESTHSPTILKSQNRLAKDTCVISVDDKMYFPSEQLTKKLMGIGEDFTLENCSTTIASEIIGQSVDMGSHLPVIRSVKKHIMAFFESMRANKKVIPIRKPEQSKKTGSTEAATVHPQIRLI